MTDYATLRYEVPADLGEALREFGTEPVVHGIVESIADDLELSPREVLVSYDAIRLPAELVLEEPINDGMTDEVLPDRVDLRGPARADGGDDEGGRTFTAQPETCDECGETLTPAGRCKTRGCDGGT
ncbi:CxxC motif protein [Halorubrum phage Hardycor1]|nr:CxxC motif protein [Halorubrum phage Hardycor1]